MTCDLIKIRHHSNCCRAWHDKGLICTRKKFHSGKHHAHTTDECLIIWGNEEEIKGVKVIRK